MVAVVGYKFDHTKGIAIQEKGREDRVPPHKAIRTKSKYNTRTAIATKWNEFPGKAYRGEDKNTEVYSKS